MNMLEFDARFARKKELYEKTWQFFESQGFKIENQSNQKDDSQYKISW